LPDSRRRKYLKALRRAKDAMIDMRVRKAKPYPTSWSIGRIDTLRHKAFQEELGR